MKRVYICIVIFGCVLSISTYCMNELTTIEQGIETRIDKIIEVSEYGDLEKAHELTLEIQDYWVQCEHKMMKYVRHNDIDTIAISISRLPYLAKYEDMPELLSEAHIIKNLIYHVWDSERILWRNII